MATHDELKARAVATYNAAADWYDAPDNSFWNRFGQRTVDRLALRPGLRVLDVCSGSGGSAIPAALAVGPGGRVVATDVAQGLLELLGRKAADQRMTQIECRQQDLLTLDLDDRFDAVVCVFGIFFVGDMVAGVQRLWRHVKPGGQLAITTWGPRFAEPLNSAFWDAVRDERPELYKGFNPWDTITEPRTLRGLLERSGVTGASIEPEWATHALSSPQSWWALVQGSGYRGTLDQLSAEARERVRQHNLQFIAAHNVTEVESNVVYAVGRKGT